MRDKLTEMRERHGRQYLPRLFSSGADDTPIEIHDRYLGVGVAVGGSFGVAIGAGFGGVFGSLPIGIAFGICIGTALGIAIGATLDDKHANTMQASSD